MQTNDKELRDMISDAMFGKSMDSVDDVMDAIEQSCRRREAETVVEELENVYGWRQLYTLNSGSVSVFVVHANRIKDRIAELKATIRKEET
jgi:uncharacterized protein YaaQ